MGHVVSWNVLFVLSELSTSRSRSRKADWLVDFLGYFLEATTCFKPGGITRVSRWIILIMCALCRTFQHEGGSIQTNGAILISKQY